jgi:ABC-type transport system involved in cytochrome c biogenesis permease component
VFLVEVVTLPLAAVLYHVALPEAWPTVLLVLVLGTTGFCRSAHSMQRWPAGAGHARCCCRCCVSDAGAGAGAASRATASLLVGDVMGDSRAWIRLLAAFDIIFVVAATWSFQFVIEG